jgi:hypothetical protein
VIPIWWSILLAAVGILGLYISIRKLWWGWAISLSAQALWIAYGLVTAQYGFILSALVYGAFYAYGARQWRKEVTA